MVLFAAIGSFGIYAHAIRKLFSREHGVDVRMKVLQVAGLLSAAGQCRAIWTAGHLTAGRGLIALGLYMSALGLFFTARAAIVTQPLSLAFSPDLPKQLLSNGIYAWIRHPFYSAYSVTWMAGVVVAPGLATLTTAAMMFGLYNYAAHVEERKFMESELRAAYTRYRMQAGMFWPKRLFVIPE